jgi:hypothetical protein
LRSPQEQPDRMSGFFVVLVFGFPAVFLSLLISVIGIVKEKYWLVIIGAVLFIPFSYYLNGALGANGFAILLPLFQIVSAAAIREGNRLWAWLMLVPAFLAGLWVLAAGLISNFS